MSCWGGEKKKKKKKKSYAKAMANEKYIHIW